MIKNVNVFVSGRACRHCVLALIVVGTILLPFRTVALAQGCINPPPDMIGWWTGDGTAADFANGHDGTLQNGATYGAGQVGQAFQLDGSNDFVDVASVPELNVGTGDFTIDLWVNFDSVSGEQTIFEKWDGSPGWTLSKRDGILFAIGNESSNIETDSGPSAGHWTHYAARRGSGSLAIFVDGELQATGSNVENLDTVSSMKLGRRTGSQGFFLNGRIDEVQLFGRALSDSEIIAIHDAGSDGQCRSRCGDGVTEGAETCDDSNLVDDDGCDRNCTTTGCGNGIVTAGEVCDDGDLVDGNGCDSNCTPSACGNGVRTEIEGCDDGNVVGDDGCESDCTYTPLVESVSAGATVTTDPLNEGASPARPIQTAITTPNAGTVSVAPASVGAEEPAGLDVLGVQLQIEAPPATASVPLVLVLTVDASLLPPGADAAQVDVIRNGEPVEDCTGAPGTASPDPCIGIPSALPGGDVELTIFTSHASLWGAVVQGLSVAQQKCVNGINSSGVKVAMAQTQLNAACVKEGAKSGAAGTQTCLEADLEGKVSAAQAKVGAVATASCPQAPPFGFTGASAVNTSARDEALAMVSDLFGADLAASIVPTTDVAGSKVQAAVLKACQGMLLTKASMFLKCKKDGLSGKSDLLVSSGELERCFDIVAADAQHKIEKSVTKLGTTIGKFTGTLASVFPGSCGASANFVQCVEARADCRACRMFDAMDGLSEDCDAFDDGLPNSSCP